MLTVMEITQQLVNYYLALTKHITSAACDSYMLRKMIRAGDF